MAGNNYFFHHTLLLIEIMKLQDYKGFEIRKEKQPTGEWNIRIYKNFHPATIMIPYTIKAARRIIDTFAASLQK